MVCNPGADAVEDMGLVRMPTALPKKEFMFPLSCLAVVDKEEYSQPHI